MPTYSVQAPNGKTYSIDGPAGADDATVHAQILSQHPEAAGMTLPPTPRSPAPVPVTSKRQSVADYAQQRVAAEQAGHSSGITGTIADIGSALEAGAEKVTGLPTRLRAAARYYLPGEGGDTNPIPRQTSYAKQLEVERAVNDAEANRSGTGNVLGQVLGSIGPGRAAGKLATVVGKRALASSVPGAAAVGRGLNVLTTLKTGQPIANVAKAATIGAGVGGAQAVGTGDDVKRGIVGGAIGGAGGHLLAAGAGKVASAVADRIDPNTPVIGRFATTAADLLQRYVKKATPEQIQSTAAQMQAETGFHPTLAEVINRVAPDDGARLAAAMRRSSPTTRVQLNTALRQRAADMGQQLGQQTDTILSGSQNANRDAIAQRLAQSRGQTAPSTDDIALAQRAISSPTDMQQVRSTLSRNFMAPHDDRIVANSVADLHPSFEVQTPGAPQPTGLLDGNGQPITRPGPPTTQRVISQEDQPIVDMINQNTVRSVKSQQGITGRNVSDLISNLREIATGGGDNAPNARRALEHVESLLPDDMRAANDASRQSFAETSRILEGMDAGKDTQLRSEAERGIGTSAKSARLIRNAYDTIQGAQGRAIGQTNELARQFGSTPEDIGRTADTLANRPNTAAALANNLTDSEANQITNAARTQTQGVRGLIPFSTDPAQDAEVSASGIMHQLIGLAPGSLPHTKVRVLTNMLDMLKGSMPEAQTRQIIDGIFSQNPAAISRGLGLLSRAGEPGKQAMRLLGASLSGAAGSAFVNSQSAYTPAPLTSDGTPPQNAMDIQPAGDGMNVDDSMLPVDANSMEPGQNAGGTPAPDASLGQGAGADPSASPYAPVMDQYFGSQSPDMQDLINRVQHQESGGRQHDQNGNPLTSSAGAIGNMQVMPSTGKAVAAKLGINWDEAAFNHDPSYNKLIGTAYLSDLLDQFDGNVAEAVAAYNAGPGAVIKAIRDGGNWLARLPKETQNYVRAVA